MAPNTTRASVDLFCQIMKSLAKVFGSAFSETTLPFHVNVAVRYLEETNVLSFCFAIAENISCSSTSNLFETTCSKTSFPLSSASTRSFLKQFKTFVVCVLSDLKRKLGFASYLYI
jgi:hypothetical protein